MAFRSRGSARDVPVVSGPGDVIAPRVATDREPRSSRGLCAAGVATGGFVQPRRAHIPLGKTRRCVRPATRLGANGAQRTVQSQSRAEGDRSRRARRAVRTARGDRRAHQRSRATCCCPHGGPQRSPHGLPRPTGAHSRHGAAARPVQGRDREAGCQRATGAGGAAESLVEPSGGRGGAPRSAARREAHRDATSRAGRAAGGAGLDSARRTTGTGRLRDRRTAGVGGGEAVLRQPEMVVKPSAL
jgi:hypothetical protein